MREIERVFLQLVRLGIGANIKVSLQQEINWNELKVLAEKQGLLAVMVDGVDRLPEETRPPKSTLLRWIGQVIKEEELFSVHRSVEKEISLLFHENHIRTYVLKGVVVSECYPKPEHRVSSDMDCFLLSENGSEEAWALGNNLIQAKGVDVNLEFYKNSSFSLTGLIVENHRYMIPFRGNKRLKYLEVMLQGMMMDDLQSRQVRGYKGGDAESRRFWGTWLYRPPIMVSALFLIEHAYSHFLHEGLMWRHVLDWRMFSHKHKEEIEWGVFETLIDEFGFRRFYDSFCRLGLFLLGEMNESDLSKRDILMLKDIWSDLDIHETVHGIKGKVSLAGNTWRARWKYRHFSEISMLHALWIQIKGFLFIKNPVL